VDIDEFLDSYERKRVPARICPKASLVLAHADAEAKLSGAQKDAKDDFHNRDVAALAREVRELEAEIKASERTFWFEGVSYRDWQDLKRKHPATKAQKQDDGLDINIDTFALPAIAASCVDPKMNTEQAKRLAETLPDGEIQKLFRATLQANGETFAPKSVLAGVIEGIARNGKSSITAALAESPEASSSVDSDEPSPSTSTTNPDG
jgi:hypothetical protein